VVALAVAVAAVAVAALAVASVVEFDAALSSADAVAAEGRARIVA
jgi:hypothetical protein